MSSLSPNQAAALDLASQSLHVFPCNPNRKPIWKEWEQNATNNILKIVATWQGNPQLLPAIPVGAHSLVVIDCDRKNGNDGVTAFTALCAAHSIDLSCAFVVETPSGGGLHFYFRSNIAYVGTVSKIAPGIDVRSHGNFVFGPGATLEDGRSYRIVQGTWDAIPALSPALAAFLREKQPAVTPATADSTSGLPATPVPAHVTDRDLNYAASALEVIGCKLDAMQPGSGRNDALNSESHGAGTLVGNGSVDYEVAKARLTLSAERNGHTAKHGLAQTIATIESGLNAGARKPRTLKSMEAPDIDISGIVPGNSKSKHAEQQKPSRCSVLISRGTDIQARPIDWLWPDYLPKGMLTILAGEGGTGKSTIAFNLAATITNGGYWPDGTRCNAPGNVLIFSTEDDPETVIQPRLIAAGANLNHYGVIRGTLDDKGRKRAFDANRDMELLREAFQQIGSVSLLVIDPIVTLVKGDINQSNVVRQSLEAVIDLASEYKCSVVGITHFAKNSKGKSLVDRVLSSRAFTDLARMVWAVVQNRETGERAFGRIKTNIARENDAFPYSVEELWISEQIRTTRISWGNRIDGSSHLILGRIEGTPETDNEGKVSQVKQYLLQHLAHGPVPAKEITASAIEQLNVCRNTVTTAKRDLNVESLKDGTGGWKWSLPLSNQVEAARKNI